jgi:hypothetical protein
MDAGNRRRARNGNLVVRADIPGIKPEEVKIEVEDARGRSGQASVGRPGTWSVASEGVADHLTFTGGVGPV